MQKVLTSAQMREVDRLTTERYGIPSILLMENAAHAVARVITEKLGGSVKGKSILILCGKGNNGGDGAALGWKLALADAAVEILIFGKVADTRGDARINFDAAERFVDLLREINSQEEFDAWLANARQDWDIVVDAVFGTGLGRPLDVWLGNVIRHMNTLNESGRLALSVDIPSGLNSDFCAPIGEAFQADVTVTFSAPKPANVLAPASSYGGELIIAEIGSPYELIEDLESQTYVADRNDAYNWLYKSRFQHDSYKNKRGQAMIAAGSEDYSGAAVLAANAAMRSGVGLVTLACPAAAKAEVASRLLPEVILSTVESDEFSWHLEKADAIAVGCGLDANDPEIERLARQIVSTRRRPVIVDAGALCFFSPFDRGYVQPPATAGGTDLILTPHEGEFLRLLGTNDKGVLKDRVDAVRDFATKNGVILVLKGERVLIGHPDGRVVVNPTGNSGLGKAGNGDTLTGILAGFAAQAVRMDIEIFETVIAAVYVAGMAGDVAEKKYGKRVMTASDVRECLTEVFAGLEDGNTVK